MKKWNHRFDFTGFYQSDEIPVAEKAQKIADILREKLLPMFDEITEGLHAFVSISRIEPAV